MNINVDPSFFQRHEDSAHVTPQVNSNKDLESIRKKETDVTIEGDIFTYSGVSFAPMTTEELINEKIDMKSLNLKSTTTSEKTIDDRIIIAFRDPNDPKNIIAYKLDSEIVDELKASFSTTDFFQREDGILRLNAEAEAYVAGWVQDIKENRGYEKADANGNGFIEENEQGELNIGFDHHSDYDYLGEKIVSAHTAVGGKTYQKFSHTGDSVGTTTPLVNQALKFENTIEKELSHTIKLDKDKDGTIALKEGLEDFTSSEQSVEELVASKTKINHDAWVTNSDIVLDLQKIETRDIATQDISDKDLSRRYGVTGVNGERIMNMTMDEMKDFLGEDFAKNSKYDLETIIDSLGIIALTFNERQKQFEHENVEIPPLELAPFNGLNFIDVKLTENDKNIFKDLDITV